MSITHLPGSKLGRLALVAAAAGVIVLSGCGGGDDTDDRPSLTAGGDESSSSSTTESTPTDSESSETPIPEDPETQGVFDITVGDCLSDDVGEGEVSEVPTVPCDGPHDAEVYLSVIMDDADTFPGDAAVETASQDCIGQGFTDFVGLEYNSSVLTASTLTPTQESWENNDDREILCLIKDPAGPVTGTLSGANR